MPEDTPHHLHTHASDPREAPRVRLCTTGIITATAPIGSPTYGVRVLDVSVGGARIISAQRCLVGHEFDVILRFQPQLLRLQAAVVWLKPRAQNMYECGVSIRNISPQNRAYLTDIVADRLRPQRSANCAFYPAKPATSSSR